MKNKLNLNELKVKSFVTSQGLENAETLKGGRHNAPSGGGGCSVIADPKDKLTANNNLCTGRRCQTGHLCYVSINASC